VGCVSSTGFPSLFNKTLDTVECGTFSNTFDIHNDKSNPAAIDRLSISVVFPIEKDIFASGDDFAGFCWRQNHKEILLPTGSRDLIKSIHKSA